MLQNINRVATYRKDNKVMFCEVGFEDGIQLYGICIVDNNIYHNRHGKTFQRLPYMKYFRDKAQANRYTMAIIKKDGWKKDK